MALDRRPVLVGYLLVVVGLLLGIVVAGVIPTPAPPACSTSACIASDISAVVGLVLIVAGLVELTVVLFRRGAAAPPGATAWSPPTYSFSSTSGPAGEPRAPLVSEPPTSSPLPRFCTSCGTIVGPEVETCPKCGRPVPK